MPPARWMGVARRAGLLVPERMGRFKPFAGWPIPGAIFVGSILVLPAPPPMWRALPVRRYGGR